jgi:hypothetical protein
MHHVDESSLSANCVSDPDQAASSNLDQNSLPQLRERINLIGLTKLPEPADFRENTFKFMRAFGSSPATRSSAFDPVVQAQMRGAVNYLADHLFARKPPLDVIGEEKPLHPGSRLYVELYLKLVATIGFAFVPWRW